MHVSNMTATAIGGSLSEGGLGGREAGKEVAQASCPGRVSHSGDASTCPLGKHVSGAAEELSKLWARAQLLSLRPASHGASVSHPEIRAGSHKGQESHGLGSGGVLCMGVIWEGHTSSGTAGSFLGTDCSVRSSHPDP